MNPKRITIEDAMKSFSSMIGTFDKTTSFDVDDVFFAFYWYLQRHAGGKGSAHLVNIINEIHDGAKAYARYRLKKP